MEPSAVLSDAAKAGRMLTEAVKFDVALASLGTDRLGTITQEFQHAGRVIRVAIEDVTDVGQPALSGSSSAGAAAPPVLPDGGSSTSCQDLQNALARLILPAIRLLEQMNQSRASK